MAVRDTLTIEEIIYSAIYEYVEDIISGEVYFDGLRPADSPYEDCVIKVSAANALQIQEGRAKVNIYVPNIINNSGRSGVQDRERLAELTGTDEAIVGLLNGADTSFDWSLSAATAIVENPATNEYFLNINLAFRATTF